MTRIAILLGLALINQLVLGLWVWCIST